MAHIVFVKVEDIEFNFNNKSNYWPSKYQNIETEYHLGFFAGITIESDYVTVDLNGFKLRQSYEFYFQQKWFSIIELNQMKKKMKEHIDTIEQHNQNCLKQLNPNLVRWRH